jgi:uncharacterized protein (DUF433 family)
MSVEIGSLLTRTPEVRRGRPCIAGTGVSVHRVAIMYKMGEGPEEIAREYPHLPLAGVYAALAYYHANQAEVEAEIAEDEAEGDRAEAEWYRSRDSRVA